MILQQQVCDMCHARGEGMIEATTTRTVSVDKRSIEVDLCEVDDETLTEAMAPYFQAGRRVRTATKKASRTEESTQSRRPTAVVDNDDVDNDVDSFRCVCGRGFGSQRGLTRHIKYPPADMPEGHNYTDAA